MKYLTMEILRKLKNIFAKREKTMENLLKCDGRRFRAKIDGVTCEGKVRVEDGKVYLCQNNKDGCKASNKYGYKYSWKAYLSGDGSIDPSYSVHDFCLLDMTSAEIEVYKDWQVGDRIRNGDIVWEVIFRSGKVVVCVNSSGSATANYTCEELYNDGWRLVAEEDRDVHESGKTDTYKPKEGDLVYAGSTDGRQASIYLFEAYSPSVHRGFNSKCWEFSVGTIANVQFIRRATAEETVLFTDILAKNGYKYNPQKKEVRNSWRAKDGEQYFYISSALTVCMASDSRCLQANVHYSIDNYFRTREEAEEVAAEFREILNKRQ